MSSAYAPWGRRILQRWVPWLFWICPAGNRHWRWNCRICYCRLREHGRDAAGNDWHGGIWVDGREWLPYEPPETVGDSPFVTD